jgi:hypothetical protein
VHRVLFSVCLTESLASLFASLQLRPHWVALIRPGCAPEGSMGEPVLTLPALLEEQGLLPEAFIGDRDWNRIGYRGYERLLGGGVRGWGWCCAAIWPRSDVHHHYQEAIRSRWGRYPREHPAFR